MQTNGHKHNGYLPMVMQSRLIFANTMFCVQVVYKNDT